MAERHETLADLLQAVNRGMYEHIRGVLQEYGLPVISMVVMRQIREEQGITISEMSRRTGIAKSHVSNTIESLAQQGFVEKRPDPSDQRLVRVYTTERADNHFQQMQADIRQQLSALIAGVPEEKVEALIEGLQILKGAMGQRKGC